MRYKNTYGVKKLLLLGLMTCSLPGHVYAADNYVKGGAALVAFGSALYGGYYYGYQSGKTTCKKTLAEEVHANEAKIIASLMRMEFSLQNMLDTPDLVVYARGTYGYTVQPIAMLQRSVQDITKHLSDLQPVLVSDAQREHHKKACEALEQVRIKLGKLDPAVFEHEDRIVRKVEKEKQLEAEAIKHQRALQKQHLQEEAKTYRLVQKEQLTKIEANKLEAEARRQLIAQRKLMEAVARDHELTAQICKVLPETIAEVGKQQAQMVSAAMNEFKVEAGSKLDEVAKAHINTQEKLAQHMCQVAKDQTTIFASHVSKEVKDSEKLITKNILHQSKGLKDQNDQIAKKLTDTTSAINTLEAKVSENVNQMTKQGADITSIKSETSAVKQLAQENKNLIRESLEVKRNNVTVISESSTF